MSTIRGRAKLFLLLLLLRLLLITITIIIISITKYDHYYHYCYLILDITYDCYYTITITHITALLLRILLFPVLGLRWILKILHDPRYLAPREEWYYSSILGSCRIFSINSSTSTRVLVLVYSLTKCSALVTVGLGSLV